MTSTQGTDRHTQNRSNTEETQIDQCTGLFNLTVSNLDLDPTQFA